jgi:YebC/PmpR family DNA-binding regulatory protein
MSGHNKWSKIKRKKEVTDAQKSRIFSKHAAVIATEVRSANGNVDSPKVITAIDRAKKDSMPKENIERAIAKGSGTGGAALVEVIFEGFGPGGTAILAVALTDNNNRTAAEVRHIFTKAGYSLGSPGSALWAFEKTADGFVPRTPTTLSDADGEALASLIEHLEEQSDVQDIFTSADGEEI